jgi:hypothetical protein
VEQLSEEVDSLKETLDKHSLRQKKRILEAKERAELFERAVIIPLSNMVFFFPPYDFIV